jgi:uncharacterized protein (TIGR02246 family)
MVNPIRTAFQPDAGATSAWEQARAQLARPRMHEPSLDQVRAELAIRDLIARYAYSWDQGDLDAVMAFFTEDCVITNPSGEVSGSAAIRANYQQKLRDVPRRRHLVGNVVVRLSEDLREGWLTAAYSAVLEPRDSSPRTISGLIADTVVKPAGEWKIRTHSVCIDTIADIIATGDSPEVVDIGALRSRIWLICERNATADPI